MILVMYSLQVLDAYLNPSTFQQNTHLFHLSYFPVVYFGLLQTVFFFVNPNGLEMNVRLFRVLSFFRRLCHSALHKDPIFDRMILRSSSNGSFSSGLAFFILFLETFLVFPQIFNFSLSSIFLASHVLFFSFFITITFCCVTDNYSSCCY